MKRAAADPHMPMAGGEALRSRRLRAPLALLASALCLVAALLTAAPAAAAGAPVMKLAISSQPTNFAPGASAGEGGFLRLPTYSVVATNVGTAATNGPLAFTVALPPELAPTGPALRTWENEEFSCTAAGRTVTCEDPLTLPPGRYAQVVVPVDVSAAGAAEVTTTARVSGGGASPASATTTTAITSAAPSFGLLPGAAGLNALITPAAAASGPSVQAGSRPAQLTVELGLPSAPTGEGVGFVNDGLTPAGALRDTTVDLPRGVVVDPSATPVRCTEAALENEQVGCPAASQIGTVTILTALTSVIPNTAPLYNMVPPPGAAANFGFNALGLGIYVHLLGGVRPDGEYVLSARSSEVLARPFNPILGVQVALWGDPSSQAHDSVRGECAYEYAAGASCPVPVRNAALLTAPSACSSGLGLSAAVDSWQEPGRQVAGVGQVEALAGGPVGVTGCERLDFSPRISITPEVGTADTPTGLHVDLHVPQDGSLNTLAEANLKDAVVTLPPGVAISPSAANGLGACSAAQFDLKGAEPAECPDDAKIGTVEVVTPLLEHPLPGAIYVARPYENPFDSLLAIYIAVHDPESGVVIKLAGHVEADPATGRLTTSFAENPELPFEDFRLDFFGGPRAALANPVTCGTLASHSSLTPWSGTAPVEESVPFTIAAGANGGACVSSEAQAPNAPSFEAGTTQPLAGAYSPFVLHLHREDGSQRLGALNVTLPPGLLGRLAGIPYCPDSALAAAGRSGAAEQASPSCPAASQVGTVTVGAGPGPQPYYVAGKAYLAGPYKGAPLSLAIVTPAVAGPYDLGTVVVRSALHVNEETAQITVRSDPIPHILKGIPLDVRSVAVDMDRPEFTLDPTSCDPMAVGGEAISTIGSVARLSDRFQVGGCKGLKFGPDLKVHLKGATKRIGHPALKAVLTAKPGEANIGRAQVNLPHGEFLDQGNLNKTCTRPVLLAGNCPKSAVYGKAKAWTPLLEKPLQGPVYLVGGYGYKLPALVADLNGQIRILLVGKIDSGKNKGIRSTFEAVPDAPVTRFVLEMKGGKKYGLLENSENLCKVKKAKRRAIARFTGQNGKVDQYKPMVTNQCQKKGKKKGGKGK